MGSLNRQTALKCPVCNETMDIITHYGVDEDDIGAAILGGEGRREHKRKSPKCALDKRWVLGWIEESVDGV